jgi:hypothetical protein
MAITINSAPENYASAHDDLWFVATSTNVAQTNFKFVFEIYINAALVATVKQFPDPVNSKGLFNAGSIVRNYISTYFKPVAGSQTLFTYDGDDIYLPYQVRFGEEYGGTTYLNLSNTTVNAYNFVNQPFRSFGSSELSTYVSDWLTTRDLANVDVNFNESNFVSWMNPSGSTVAMTATIRVLDEAGSTVGSPTTTSSQTISAFSLMDVSPVAINTLIGSSFIGASAFGYGVKLNYASTSSEEIKCRIACQNKFTPITLHFLNQLGGYESMTFRLVNKESRSVDSKAYRRNGWQYDSGSTSMRRYNANNVANPGDVQFSTEQSVALKLRSGYLSVTDWNWLRDLIVSPEVYMTRQGYYFPVRIKTNNWEQRAQYADKSNFLELEIESSVKIYSQFR